MEEVQQGVRRGVKIHHSMRSNRSASSFKKEDDDGNGSVSLQGSDIASLSLSQRSGSRTSSGRTTASRRKVRFGRITRVHPIKHLKDIGEDERSGTWFTRFDYQRVRADFEFALNMLEHGGQVMEQHLPGLCMRGLECRTKQGHRDKRSHRKMAMKAVLAEQKRQKGADKEKVVNDDERIAYQYKKVNSSCVGHAHTIGMQDEAACREDETPIHKCCIYRQPALANKTTAAEGGVSIRIADVVLQTACQHNSEYDSSAICVHRHIPQSASRSTSPCKIPSENTKN